ncbi:hypothetical protein CJP74_00400 [Psittacicella melopsittaci]|uniref:Uncharacterized protein n=1 Tax=Psittacicella melopsittaci TaxID=2028576 RepID=A0A3A1Y8T0_9GAMM|nr:hypothetical protein [Psittacicella melopsittaci]RIY34075.1 hypothetical protein CJP74_00400 [Psittacicella melopsittaci]
MTKEDKLNEKVLNLDKDKIKEKVLTFVNREILSRLDVRQEKSTLAELLPQLHALGTADALELEEQLYLYWRWSVLGLLASCVYDPSFVPPPEGFKDVSEDEKILAQFALKVGDLELPQGHFKAKLYQKDPQVWGNTSLARLELEYEFFLSFKGTYFYSLRDWQNNLKQARGEPSAYYAQAKLLGEKVKASGKGHLLYCLGHSLGGGLAATFAQVAGVETTTFNAAGVHPSTIKEEANLSKIEALYLPGELLQEAQDFSYEQENFLGLGQVHWQSKIPSQVGKTRALDLAVGYTSLDKHFMLTLNKGFKSKLKQLQEQAQVLLFNSKK